MDRLPSECYTVYDIETLLNLSTFCFKEYTTKARKEFVIHESRNDFQELVKFLLALRKYNYYLIGFNNLFFDGQIIDFILRSYEILRVLPPAGIAGLIHHKSQELINLPEKEKYYNIVPELRLPIRQIDLYKQKHYDGRAKRTSLKWLEFTMRMENIEEMPIQHDVDVKTEDVAKVLAYNWNDVEATYEFFDRMKFETDLRFKLSKEFGLPLLNASEPRMAREILAKLLAEDLGIPVKELKDRRTYRQEIHLGKCIIPLIKFKDPVFNNLVSKLKATTINASNTKKCFEHKIIYKGVEIDYGVGGIHGKVASGIYTSDDEYVIKTVDVTSFYPKMIINYGFAPAHLGQTFANRYNWFFSERKKYSKKDPINYIYKIILNATYGLSNDVNSFLYDTLTTMKTTINGQLLLTMLAESLSEVPDSQILMLNTDGLEIRIPRTAELEFSKCCKEWEDLTRLQLEYDEYDKIVLGDINNYIAVFSKRESKSYEDWAELKSKEPYYLFSQEGDRCFYHPIKLKGRYEIQLDYHKNPSSMIVPKALFNHFVKGIPVEDSIDNCTDLYDFCIGVKKQYDFDLVYHRMIKGEYIREKQQKVTRFYVSTVGGKLTKEYHDGRSVGVNASSLVIPANRINKKDTPDNLNRMFYVDECYKELKLVEGASTNQLAMCF